MILIVLNPCNGRQVERKGIWKKIKMLLNFRNHLKIMKYFYNDYRYQAFLKATCYYSAAYLTRFDGH